MSDPSASAQMRPNETTPGGEPSGTAQRNITGAVTRRSGPGSEPPLGPLALLSTILVLASVGTSVALGGAVPSPFATEESISRYFTEQSDAVLAASVLSFASLVPSLSSSVFLAPACGYSESPAVARRSRRSRAAPPSR
jgi:hypothetical protein